MAEQANPTQWSDKRALRRLRNVVAAVPGANIGGSTKSTAFSGIASYARDMEAVSVVMRRVLDAVLAPAPDRDFGDDGYRDDVRKIALDALSWAEDWAEFRNKHNWNGDTAVGFGDKPWQDVRRATAS